MKKFNLTKGLSTALVAMALVTGLSVPVNAANVDANVTQETVTQIGAPAATSIVMKNTEMSGKDITAWNITFPAVPEGHVLYFNVYANGDPKKTESGYWYESWRYDANNNKIDKSYFVSNYNYEASEGDTSIAISASRFEPGTYTVQAYLYDKTGYSNDMTGLYKADFYSPASNALTINVGVPSISVGTVVKATSIRLDMNSSNRVTGYEIYRKVGKTYKKIANTTKATYTDSGLLSKMKYSYKVRGYYVDENTKKTIYGEYSTVDATTIGSALKLKAQVSGTKNVKLTWSKVPGAVKYEIYRMATDSEASETSKGYSNAYTSYDLIKTLKSNKKTYTDKSTTANQSYYYVVRAVLKGNKAAVVEEYEYINLGFDFNSNYITASYTNASGAVTVEWKKAYGADGYVILKKNDTTGAYEEVQRLSKTTTKITLNPPAPVKLADGEWKTEDSYQICAYKGTSISSGGYYVYPKATLGAVSTVSAKKVENGIQVSWSAVPGAAYYRVYRVKAGALNNNKNTGCYTYEGASSQVTEYVGVTPLQARPQTAGQTETTYYRNYAYTQSTTTATTMLDYAGVVASSDYSDANDLETVGPRNGVDYQYYVVAYAAENVGTSTLWSYNTTTHEYETTATVPDWSETGVKSIGCKKVPEITYSAATAPGKVKISSVKAGSKSATINFKKVSGATEYKIYRSTKKKGSYTCVGTTKKTSYKDTGLTSKKTYYYKVVAVKANEVGADVEGAASAVKSVKAK